MDISEGIKWMHDTYSFGVICWEIATREVFFGDSEWLSDIEDWIVVGKRPLIPNQRCPVLFKEVIEQCWDQDPGKRPKWPEIIENLKELQVDGEKFEKSFGEISHQELLEKLQKKREADEEQARLEKEAEEKARIEREKKKQQQETEKHELSIVDSEIEFHNKVVRKKSFRNSIRKRPLSQKKILKRKKTTNILSRFRDQSRFG